MVFRSGLLLACAAVFLQIAVFLQPLLPKQYQIAPVCETITRALLKPKAQTEAMSHAMHHSHHQHHIEQAQVPDHHDHHDANHQCQYCTVYANLVLPPEFGVKRCLFVYKFA